MFFHPGYAPVYFTHSQTLLTIDCLLVQPRAGLHSLLMFDHNPQHLCLHKALLDYICVEVEMFTRPTLTACCWHALPAGSMQLSDVRLSVPLHQRRSIQL